MRIYYQRPFTQCVSIAHARSRSTMAPLLLMIVLCLAGSESSAQAELLVGFDPNELIQLGATANCCPMVDGNEPCNKEDCPAVTDDQFRNIADRNALTEWVVSFISKDSENGPSAEISFNLGQVA